MSGKIFSPGKLLLTAEYAVLDGATALAVPTKPGQELFYTNAPDGRSEILWSAKIMDRHWFHAEIDRQKWHITKTDKQESSEFIKKVFQNIALLNPAKFPDTDSWHFTSNLEFPSNYGLGSSSTLMSNLAQWAGVDAFHLNEMSLGGSGYDVAVALEKSALLYEVQNTLRSVKKIQFDPPFAGELIFIHTNQKQNSREGIQLYRQKTRSPELIRELSFITHQVLNAKTIGEFSAHLVKHEQLLSDFLELPTAKERLFPGIPVFVKSLGAWGGDFVLSQKFDGYQSWFAGRGYATVLEYHELIG